MEMILYKKIFLGLGILFIHCLLIISPLAHADSKIVLDKEMSYPNTAWNPDYKDYLSQEPIWAKNDWKQSIIISVPPSIEQTTKEIEAINKLRSLRDKFQAEIDQEIELIGIYEKFYTVLDASPLTHPKMAEFMSEVFNDATIVVFYFKNRFNRARPYHYYPAIEATIDPPGHPSYPSGHAAQSYSLALALAEAFPNKRAELSNVAYSIARNREIAGVHYESDSEAGKEMAIQLIAQMKENSDFSDWLNQITKENAINQ